MENLIRRSVAAAGVACPLLILLASLVTAEPLLAASRNSAAAGSPLPVVFEANHGQADSRVKFLARGAGYALFITTAEAVLTDRQTGQAVRVRLLGARQDAEVTGLEPLPGRMHYIRRRDPAKWLTEVPTYARVAYREAYPGIDAIYRTAAESRFEQEFLVRPGADPAGIRLEFDGVQSVAVDDAGDLVLATERAPVRLGRPVAYQEIDGARRSVPAAWVTPGSKEAGFRLGPYDRGRPLVIDPVITWATYLGGSVSVNSVARGRDQAFGIAVDNAGNSYVTGDTDSINYPTTDGSHLAPQDTQFATDAFVTKLDPTGQALVYSLYIGGGGHDGGRGIALDHSGNAYVAGFTGSTDFPTTAGAFQSQHGGGFCFLSSCSPFDAFVLKLGPAGTLVYATYLGGRDADVALGIAVDASGRAYVVGGTRSDNFPVANAFQPLHGGGGFQDCPVEIEHEDENGNFFIEFRPCPRAAFVTRLSAQGLVEYSTYLGGAGEDVANAIALHDTGSNNPRLVAAYVTGSAGGGFPTTPGSLQPDFRGGGSPDAFVASIVAATDVAGEEVVFLDWATYLGGIGFDVGIGIAIDGQRRPHVVGSTASGDFRATGGDRFTGVTEGFVARLAADGSAIDWSRNTGTAIPAGVALDGQGRTHLVGSVVVCTAFSSAVPPTCVESNVDVAVETRAATGERLSFISFGGTNPLCCVGNDFGEAIAASGNSVWVTGTTDSGNFPITPGTFQPTLRGGTDAFVVRLGEPAVAADGGDSGGGSGGGCLIATAAFGSPLAGEVQTLRRFRDRALLTHPPGRLLVDAYYRLSPPLASAVARQPLLAAGVRVLLRPVAFGAGFALDRPAVAMGLGGVGLAVIVGLALARGRNARRIRAATITGLLLGSLLFVGVLVLGPRETISPSLAPMAPMDPGAKAQGAPGAPAPWARPAGAPRRPQAAEAALDFTTLAGGGASITLLDPFAPPAARRWEVRSALIEGILSPDGFVVTDPRRARALGIEAGDTIVRVNGHPPTGLVAVITTLQRDPDRTTVVLEIDRAGSRLVQSYRVR